MMHNNGHPAQPAHAQQVYRTHNFNGAPPTWQQQQQMQQQQMQQQQMQQQMPPPPLAPARQATNGASNAMSGMVIKQEADAGYAGYRPRSIGRNEPPSVADGVDPEDLRVADGVIADLTKTPWRRVEVTLDNKADKEEFHAAVQILWSPAMFHSHAPADVAKFDRAARLVRKVCAERFPDSLKDLSTVCPGLTVMQQPADTRVHRLYYGFDICGGANFWSVATVDIDPRAYGFDIVNVNQVGFRMVESASKGDQARYERELASGLYAYNKDLFKKNKELRSAIGKKARLPSTKARVGA